MKRTYLLLSLGVILAIFGVTLYIGQAQVKDRKQRNAATKDTTSAESSESEHEEDVATLVEKSGGDIEEAYTFAVAHPDVLESIPCFCGCYSSGHKSNKDCFIEKASATGEIEYAKHGLNCGHCVDVALEVKALLAEGKSIVEIRAVIDEKFKGYEGTPTPMPQ